MQQPRDSRAGEPHRRGATDANDRHARGSYAHGVAPERHGEREGWEGRHRDGGAQSRRHGGHQRADRRRADHHHRHHAPPPRAGEERLRGAEPHRDRDRDRDHHGRRYGGGRHGGDGDGGGGWSSGGHDRGDGGDSSHRNRHRNRHRDSGRDRHRDNDRRDDRGRSGGGSRRRGSSRSGSGRSGSGGGGGGSSGGGSSSGHDDSYGHLEAGAGSWITSRFQVLRKAGEGTFGKVFACVDFEPRGGLGRAAAVDCRRAAIARYVGAGSVGPETALVAIKVVRRVRRYTESAQIEADILRGVDARAASAGHGGGGGGDGGGGGGRGGDGGAAKAAAAKAAAAVAAAGHANIVCFFGEFMFGEHKCLVFESLGMSLYDWLKKHAHAPFPTCYVRSFARQLLAAVGFLHGMGLVHTDLKLENVLLAQPSVGVEETSQSPRLGPEPAPPAGGRAAVLLHPVLCHTEQQVAVRYRELMWSTHMEHS